MVLLLLLLLSRFSRVRLFATLCTVSHQASLSMGFSRQEYWIGLPFPSPGDLPDPGMEPQSPALAGGFCSTEPPGEPIFYGSICYNIGEGDGIPFQYSCLENPMDGKSW